MANESWIGKLEALSGGDSSDVRHDHDAADVLSDVCHDHNGVWEPCPTQNEALNAMSWKNIRSELLRAVTELFAMPLEKNCCVCCEATACM